MSRWIYEHRFGIILCGLSVLILLPFLGAVPLIDPDEPVYGQTAREMLLAGDWLSPRIYGRYWYDKPPLFYWMEMISYSLFGISDGASRLPSALTAMAAVGLVYVQGKNIFNQPVAFLSALILLTSIGFMYIAKAAVTDMTFMFTLTAAFLLFYREKYYAAYAFCGLSLLAKGPAGFLFPAAVMGIYIMTGRRHLIRTMNIVPGIVIACAVGLPWYIAMYRIHGDIFLQTFIGFHNITRFLEPEHAGQNSLFFYIPVFAGAMMPWTAALFPAVRRLYQKRDPFKDAVWYCFIWMAFVFVFFSFSATQLITYIAPAFPPAAYIIAWHLYRCCCEKKQCRSLIAASCLLAVILLLCSLIPLNKGAEFFDPAIFAGSVFLSAALFVPAMWLCRNHWRCAFVSAVSIMVLFSGVFFGKVMPSIGRCATSFEAASVLHDVYDGRSALYIEQFLRPGIAYYSGLHGTPWNCKDCPDFAAILHDPEKVYVVMTKSTFSKLNDTVPELRRYGMAGDLPSQVILINHP